MRATVGTGAHPVDLKSLREIIFTTFYKKNTSISPKQSDPGIKLVYNYSGVVVTNMKEKIFGVPVY